MHFPLRVSHGQQCSCCMRERNNTNDVKVKSRNITPSHNRKRILEPTPQNSISNHSSIVEANNSDHFDNSDSQRSSRSTGSSKPIIKWSRQQRSTSTSTSKSTTTSTSNSNSNSNNSTSAAAMNLSDHFSNNGSSHHRRGGVRASRRAGVRPARLPRHATPLCAVSSFESPIDTVRIPL